MISSVTEEILNGKFPFFFAVLFKIHHFSLKSLEAKLKSLVPCFRLCYVFRIQSALALKRF